MSHTWVVLSLISAFTLATSDAFTKKALKEKNEYVVAWFRLLFSIPLLLPLLFLIPKPTLGAAFYKAFALSLPFEILAFVLYMKALKVSPLNLTLPFLSLTPVFLILVSYGIVGEKVSVQGGIGILILAAGSYVLHLHQMRRGIFEPFRAIFREKGSIYMLFVALIYSVTSSLGKVAIEASSPLFFGTTYFIALILFFTPVALLMGRLDIRRFVQSKQYRVMVLPGIFYSIMIVSHMLAMSLTKVAYMISLKRTSVIIGVIYGYILFRERNIKERLAGAIIMLVGFVMIVTAE
jgi:drug/metabolite transporter (DMT)-like permease